MLERDDYPAGVPCWIDLVQGDLDATMGFYSGLFGWDFEVRTPPGAPFRYAYARLGGGLVAGVGGTREPGAAGAGGLRGWTSYVCVDSVDDTVAKVWAQRGAVVLEPTDITGAGRVAVCADPAGAVIGVWEPAELRGAQVVNAPGAWNFSELHTPDPGVAEDFYGAVFGWVASPLQVTAGLKAWTWQRQGYGDFLAERDPELRARHAEERVPEGFSDAVALMNPPIEEGDRSHWSITFAVDDAAAAVARSVELGATVVTPLFDTDYTRQALVRDPQGAELSLSEYRPPT